MPKQNKLPLNEVLDLNNRLLEAILKHAPILISAKDTQGNVLFASDEFSVLDGPKPEEYVNKNVFDLFPETIAEQLWRNDLKAQRSEKPIIAEEEVFHADGTKHVYHTCKFRLLNDSNELLGTCAVSVDITHLKRMEHDALHDPLTDLYNRRNLDSFFSKEQRRARRAKEQLLFILFDLDAFKQFNDELGHIKGDELLVDFSKQLKSHFKRPSDFCFRLGGDEFAVILSTDNTEKSIEQVGRVIKDVYKHWKGKYKKPCSVSAGVCIASDTCTSKRAYREADKALYTAKENGKHQVVVY